MRTDFDLAILKPLWSRRPDGRWAIYDMKGIQLKPKTGCSPDFFAFESDMELMTSTPPKNLHDMFASFGSTNFLVKQSILPVVAWVNGEDTVRCILITTSPASSGCRSILVQRAGHAHGGEIYNLAAKAPFGAN